MDRFEELVKRLTEEINKEVKEINKYRITLCKQSWIDMASDKSPICHYEYGITIKDKELSKAIARMLDIVYDDCCHSVDFIAVTKNGVYVKYAIDRYNQYGSYVGSDLRYERLDYVLDKFKKKVAEMPDRKELLNAIKTLLEKFAEGSQ